LKEPSRAKITTIGLDVAKSVFQIHGIDGAGIVLLRGQLKRRQVPGFIEACASSHHRSRELQAVGHNAPEFTCPRNEGRAKLERPSNEAIRGRGLARGRWAANLRMPAMVMDY
jgi:transposase